MCLHSLIFGVAGLYLSPWDRHYFNTTWDPTCATQDTKHNRTKQNNVALVTQPYNRLLAAAVGSSTTFT